MQALVPTTNLGSLRREMDRLFDRFWDGDALPEMPSLAEWIPSMDVSESKDAFTLEVEVPGIEPKDIHVSLQDQVLTIKGEKKHENEEKHDRFYRVERCYGSFARSLRLPVAVDANKVNATFKNGLLTVTLTKVAEAKGITIPVRMD